MCGKSLGQLFQEVNDKIEALEERVEQLEAEQRPPLVAYEGERWDDPLANGFLHEDY